MIIHHGICRTVLLIGPYAIKIPRLTGWNGKPRARMWAISRAVQANLSEQQWSEVEGVAPLLHSWLGGLVHVYRRAEPWPEDACEPDYDAIGEGWLPRDRKPENVGLIDGEPVWVDYDGSWNGCPHSRNVANLSMEDEDE